MFTVAITEENWITNLKSLRLARNQEVNFWTPTPWNMNINVNSNYYFMLKAPIRKVCGQANFLRYENMTESEAWNQFGVFNGVINFNEMQSRLAFYRERRSVRSYANIGCAVLNNVQLWNESEYVNLSDVGLNFATQIVKYKKFSGYSIPTSNIYNDIEKINNDSGISETQRQVLINARIGQGDFREDLKEYWNGCSLTGYTNTDLLIASHIKPWKDSDNEERLDKYNGLLLMPNIDKLFDRGLISFEDNGSIIISQQLTEDDVTKFNIEESMRLELIDEHMPYIEYHRNNVFQN